MKIYLIAYYDGTYKAFSTCEKMVEFILADIHHFWETIDEDLKFIWESEEVMLSEFKRDGGVEELFYTLEVPFDDFKLTEWF